MASVDEQDTLRLERVAERLDPQGQDGYVRGREWSTRERREPVAPPTLLEHLPPDPQRHRVRHRLPLCVAGWGVAGAAGDGAAGPLVQRLRAAGRGDTAAVGADVELEPNQALLRATKLLRRIVVRPISDARLALACARTARAEAAAPIETLAWERAVTGIEEDVIHYGKKVGTRRKRSDAVFRMILQASDPDKYGRAGAVLRARIEQELRPKIEQEVREEMARTRRRGAPAAGYDDEPWRQRPMRGAALRDELEQKLEAIGRRLRARDGEGGGEGGEAGAQPMRPGLTHRPGAQAPAPAAAAAGLDSARGGGG